MISLTPNGALAEFNHAHDARGRFASGRGGSAAESIPAGKKGECFRNAARYTRLHDDYDLVHGKVTNGAGRTFDHAWAESATTVADPTTGVKMAKDRWYRLVQAQPEAKYTGTQATRNLVRTGNFGPWTDAEVGTYRVREANPCHNPSGPKGGQFCGTGFDPPDRAELERRAQAELRMQAEELRTQNPGKYPYVDPPRIKSTGPAVWEDEENAMKNYENEGYRAINGSLRGTMTLGFETNEKTAATIAALDKVMLRGTIDEATTLYRGVKAQHLTGLHEGDEFVDRGFVSTSQSRENARKFGGGNAIAVHLPAGTHALFPEGYWSDSKTMNSIVEHEWILDRGLKFRVAKVVNGAVTEVAVVP